MRALMEHGAMIRSGKRNESRTTRFWWFALLTAALLVRAMFLAFGGRILDSDEAIVGLMAKHISEGAPWPVFYYGQDYMGSLEPLLTSIVFSIFGVHADLLKIVPLIFSLILVLIVYALTRRIGGLFAARIAALYLAFSPVALIEWGTKARGGFIELVVLGALALLVAAKLLDRQEGRPQSALLTFLGMVLGLAWWTNNQAIFFMAAIGLVFLFEFPKRFGWSESFRSAAKVLIFFVLGGAPFWSENLFSHPRFKTFAVLGNSAGPSDAIAHLLGFFSDSLPILLGAKRFWTAADVFPGATAIIGGAFLFSVMILLAVCKRSVTARLVAVMLFVTPLIFSLSSFGWLTQAPRYLLPLYVVIPIAFGLAAAALRAYSRIVCAAFLVAVFGVNIASSYWGEVAIPGQPFVAHGERVSEDHSALYQWLDLKGYHRISTNYWIGYRVAFETHERVTFSLFGDPHQLRIPWYEADEQHSDVLDPFVLVPSQAAAVEASLIEAGYEFKREFVSGYVVLHELTAVSPLGVQIPLTPEQISVPSRPAWVKNLIDSSPGTRWGSGIPQNPQLAIEIRFPAPVDLTNVIIEQGFWTQDTPDALSIAVIHPDGSSCEIYDGPAAAGIGGAHGVFRLNFPVEKASGLRIQVQSRHDILDWSIAELKLFGPAARSLGADSK